MIITLDGPTASGKSTLARMLAQQFGIYYINSGLLFRALAYLLTTHHGYTVDTVHDPARELVDFYLDSERFSYRYDQQTGEHIVVDGVDITPYLKTKEMDQAASIMSTNGYVRTQLLNFQRRLAEKRSVVIDGRDTGSIIFPHADYKFFITASVPIRARRWSGYLQEKGILLSEDEAIESIVTRDQRDITRAIAPLAVPADAIIIDTSSLTIAQAFDQLCSIIMKHSRI